MARILEFFHMSIDKRPMFLDLLSISLPVTALVSILHRVTGILILLSLPILVFMFYLTMSSQEGFALWQSMYNSYAVVRFVVFGMYASISYHAIAGIRHMVHDFSHCHELSSSILSAKTTLAVWLVQALVFFYLIMWGIV